ncbi:sterol desaturase family protein [Larkinella ripae]
MNKYLLPIFIVFIVLELVWKYRTRRTVSPRDYTHNGILFVLNNIVGFLTRAWVLGAYFWVYQYRLFDLGTAWWVWVLAFLADDLSYYLLHLASHKWRFFWASHVVHHSSDEFNLSTNLRQSFTGNLTGTFLIWAWIPLLGVDPMILLVMHTVRFIHQFWIHTEAIDKFWKPVEFIFMTPSHHRVHHFRHPDYHNKNLGGVLILWDRLFGTFREETERHAYGVDHPHANGSIVSIVFHEWFALLNEFRLAVWKKRMMKDER